MLLAISGILPSIASVVYAANYFDLDQNEVESALTAQSPYNYTQSTIDLSGKLINGVADSDLSVKVEQILLNGTTEKVVNTNNQKMASPQPGKFEALGVPLYDGLNKITLSGSIGSGQRGEQSHYIFYNSNISLQGVKAFAGSNEYILSESTAVTVSQQTISLEVTALNAEEVIINGKNAAPVGQSKFVSTLITLQPGRNDITITLKNRTTERPYTRTIHFFDGKNLFVDANVNVKKIDGSYTGDQALINNEPTFNVDFSNGTNNITADFKGKLLLPASLAFNAGNLDISLNGTPITTGITLGSPQPQGDSYTTYDLTITGLPLQPPGTNKDFRLKIGTQNLSVSTTYETFFNFHLKNDSMRMVTGVDWIKNYPDGPRVPLSSTTTTVIPNSEVYLAVKTNRPVPATPGTPVTDWLALDIPYGGSGMTIAGVSNTTNEVIIQVTGIPEGTHSISFHDKAVTDSNYYFVGNISYASNSGIIFKNMSDGMTFTTTDKPNKLVFELNNMPTGYDLNASGSSLQLGNIELLPATYNSSTKEYTVDLTGTRELRSGENKFVFALKNNQKLITTRALSVYVIDDKIPKIYIFKPTSSNTTRPDVTSKQSLADSAGISYNFSTNQHTTTKTAFDVMIKADQVRDLLLTMDGKDLLKTTGPIPEGTTDADVKANIPSTTLSVDGKTYDVDRAYVPSGSDAGLYLRIRDVNFVNDVGTRSLVLRITNHKGAQTVANMVVTREFTPYTIISPKPTEGSNIVVTKNFVNLEIYAEKADAVMIGKDKATTIPEKPDHFLYEYDTLKPGKDNVIKFTVVRGKDKINGQVNVYYANSELVGAMFRGPFKTKMDAFSKKLSLSFPKDTYLKTKQARDASEMGTNEILKNQKLLFGIADLKDGMVEHVTDDGHVISPSSALTSRFSTIPRTFVPASDIYWISGGLADVGNDPSDSIYKRALNGLTPYNDTDFSLNYTQYTQNRILVPTKRGTLTLAYSDNTRIGAGTNVTVFRYNYINNGVWENVGGTVNASKRTITVPFDEFGYYVVMKWRDSYFDVKGHWAQNALETLYSKGLMPSKTVGEFGANDPVTRGEFAQLIVKALNLPLNYVEIGEKNDRPTFWDVDEYAHSLPGGESYNGYLWEHKYIETAARAGIIGGMTGNYFGANLPIRRQDAAIILSRALDLKLAKNDSKLLGSLQKMFTDGATVDFYARPSVEAIAKAKLIGGKLNKMGPNDKKATYRFDPKANMTRAETAAIMVRVMQSKLKTLPKDVDTTDPEGQF